MNELEQRFVTEYRAAEEYCNELFQCRHGLREYRRRMEQIPDALSQNIAYWAEDLAALKRLISIRTDIRTDRPDCCSSRDLAVMISLRQRLENHTDPLGRLATDIPAEQSYEEEDASHFDRQRLIRFGALIAVAVVALALGILLLKVLG